MPTEAQGASARGRGWTRGAASGQQAPRREASVFPAPAFPEPGDGARTARPLPTSLGPTPVPGRLTTHSEPPLRRFAARTSGCGAVAARGHGQGRGTRASSSRIIVWGAQCSCRKPFILGAGKGLTQGRLPAPDPHPEAPGRTGLGAACGGRRWGLRGARWAGGPVAVSRAPPSSLPGSIRDQTPSNAAQ